MSLHNLNNFSNLFFFFLPSEEIPQGVCGLATTYISNLRPRRPHRPCDPGVRGDSLWRDVVGAFLLQHLLRLSQVPKPAYSAGPEPAKASSLRQSAETLESILLCW